MFVIMLACEVSNPADGRTKKNTTTKKKCKLHKSNSGWILLKFVYGAHIRTYWRLIIKECEARRCPGDITFISVMFL